MDKALALAALRAYNDWHIYEWAGAYPGRFIPLALLPPWDQTISWECDYPHSDSTWPSSPEQLARSLAGIPEDEVHLVTHGNAMRAFQLRSFDLLDRERCTVDALPAQAKDVDVTPVSGRGGIPPSRSNQPVSMADAFNQTDCCARKLTGDRISD